MSESSYAWETLSRSYSQNVILIASSDSLINTAFYVDFLLCIRSCSRGFSCLSGVFVANNPFNKISAKIKKVRPNSEGQDSFQHNIRLTELEVLDYCM